MGLLGLLNIKLSVATVGIGAMILGLGIEYGVFIY
jgi:predicted RND superfamily exporter protein